MASLPRKRRAKQSQRLGARLKRVRNAAVAEAANESISESDFEECDDSDDQEVDLFESDLGERAAESKRRSALPADDVEEEKNDTGRRTAPRARTFTMPKSVLKTEEVSVAF